MPKREKKMERPVSAENMHLDVYKDPWITAWMSDGEKKTIGLRECLTDAHNIKKIGVESCDTRIDEIAPFVLAQMLLTRVFRPTRDDKLDLFEKGCLGDSDIAKIDNYIFECEKSEILFDAFNYEKPFLQMKADDVADPNDFKPIGNIDPSALSGNNSAFYTGGMELTDGIAENNFSLTPEAYFACIVRNAMFTAATGGCTPTGLVVGGKPPLFVVINGRNLFETLVMSLPFYTNKELAKKDLPLWERGYGQIDSTKIIADGGFGPLTALLMPTASVRYGQVENGRVRNIYKKVLYKTPKKKNGGEELIPSIDKPSVNSQLFIQNCPNILTFRPKEDGPLRSVMFESEMQVWQDLLSVDADAFGGRSLEASRFISELVAEDIVEPGQKFSVSVYGLCIPTSTYPESSQYEPDADIEIPAEVMADKNAYKTLKNLIRCIRNCGWKLENALYRFEMETRGDTNPEKMSESTIRDSIAYAKQRFFETEKDRFFAPDVGWLYRIPHMSDDLKDEIWQTVWGDLKREVDRHQTVRRNYVAKAKYTGMLKAGAEKELNNVFEG